VGGGLRRDRILLRLIGGFLPVVISGLAEGTTVHDLKKGPRFQRWLTNQANERTLEIDSKKRRKMHNKVKMP